MKAAAPLLQGEGCLTPSHTAARALCLLCASTNSSAPLSASLCNWSYGRSAEIVTEQGLTCTSQTSARTSGRRKKFRKFSTPWKRSPKADTRGARSISPAWPWWRWECRRLQTGAQGRTVLPKQCSEGLHKSHPHPPQQCTCSRISRQKPGAAWQHIKWTLFHAYF